MANRRPGEPRREVYRPRFQDAYSRQQGHLFDEQARRVNQVPLSNAYDHFHPHPGRNGGRGTTMWDAPASLTDMFSTAGLSSFANMPRPVAVRPADVVLTKSKDGRHGYHRTLPERAPKRRAVATDLDTPRVESESNWDPTVPDDGDVQGQYDAPSILSMFGNVPLDELDADTASGKRKRYTSSVSDIHRT
ncbi:hypothetical protein BDZ89DRAFT_1150567 [Hymenopellis radicata]|nr:hypothetical protein BDZ89DRAFT_1150567 [Hymenopellis radicata]